MAELRITSSDGFQKQGHVNERRQEHENEDRVGTGTGDGGYGSLFPGGHSCSG